MILFLIGGIVFGTIAGLIPGLHSNNITRIAFLTPLFGVEAIVFVISMATTQSFVDFIPTIFIGAPSSSTFEGVLPGHKLFLEGRAHEAVMLTVFGGITATIISVIMLPFFIKFLEYFPQHFQIAIPAILVFSLMLLVFSEDTKHKKIIALFVIIVSATQGFFFENQIFPLISGYFGISTLIKSVMTKEKTKKQEQKIIIEKNNINDSLTGVIGGAIVSFVPGIGNNLAAAIIRLFRQKIRTKNYLVLLGSINTSNFIFSLPVLFFLNKTRNGAMVFLKETIFFTQQEIIIAVITILVSAGIGGIITIGLSKKMVKKINQRKKLEKDSKKIEKGAIIFIVLMVIFFNGLIGLTALVFSTALGLVAINKKVKRSNCLGFLIIPVLFFYLFQLI